MKKFKKCLTLGLVLAMLTGCLMGCQNNSAAPATSVAPAAPATSEAAKSEQTPSEPAKSETATNQYADTITMIWAPNESAEDYDVAREEFSKLVEQATGKKVEHQLTTDYAIAIEAMASGKAQICFNGAESYVRAHEKNNAVLPLFVNSGSSGTLDDAIYYSFLAVEEANAKEYASGDSYAIDNIEGKKMSFVSNSSTSGFKVPTTSIINHFADKNLTTDSLINAGDFFSEVMFGGSHQGSAFNLMSGKADIAAFCDTEIRPYGDCTEGKENTVGAVYTIKADATAPFDQVQGEKFTVIACTPVLNGPFFYDANTLSPEDVKAIQDLFTSDEVTNNPKIFIPEGSEDVGMFVRKGDTKFVLVEDAWFNPIREMGK